MVMALMSPTSGGNDLLCELSSNRPAYDCPNCKLLAIQFYAQIPGEPERENIVRCCACGSTWKF